ncbi:DMT family transporter [Chamaesiphon minutus]|uniref:DMT(Drug/metabolite transporter) superfamily permease n=1 Tax=Chamaesiphon minutus (strain ATCC 27169 / PCC 6605) TaxID=1173020 RepID=K9UDB4_CHAP6|nr:DMT family transporter [Chamaesiphon minutus]AFY92199.1 DMT(drug/metabolite transporter) superfamily permease [Chamaesiphon minutus PCC 6605]
MPRLPALMMPSSSYRLKQFTNRIPGQVYLWLAVPIFGASSALTRKITEIGAMNFVGGHNPISLCNVLFVGNLCALLVLVTIHRSQWNRATLSRISQREWVSLVVVAILAGALAPGLIFQALAWTPVTNVVLLGRLEPPLTLALSIWLLRERVDKWEFLGAIIAFVGVVLTVVLQPARANMLPIMGLSTGWGEILTVLGAIALAIATIVGKQRLARVPLGIYNTVRTGLGTLVFFCVALSLYGRYHFTDVLSPFLWQWMLLYGAIIVVVGQSFWTAGLRASSVATASIVGSFTPIFGILAAYLILGEVPTHAQYIGGSVILLGVILSLVGIKKRANCRQRVGAVDLEQSIESKMGFKGI